MPSGSPGRRTSSSSRCRTWSRSGRCRCYAVAGERSWTSPRTIGSATPRSTSPGTRRPHVDAAGLAEAVYGLPELHRKAIAPAGLVASPGCYPMGADSRHRAPAQERARLARGHRDRRQVGRDGSGSAGPEDRARCTSTPRHNENVLAYGLGGTHRHTPEMEQELSALAGGPVVVGFTPHLLPLNRGLFTTASVPLTRSASTADLVRLYEEFYAGEPFVRVLPGRREARPRATSWARTSATSPWSWMCARGARSAFPLSTTWARAAPPTGSQSLNIMMGWDERSGLEAPPVYP